MSGAEFDPIREEVRAEHVVDCDFHFDVDVRGDEDLLGLVHYVDDPRLEEKLELAFPPQGGHWSARYAANDPNAGNTQGKVSSTAEVLEVAEEIGVDRPLLTPNVSNFTGIQSRVMKNELVRAYNDYLLDRGTSRRDGVSGLLVLPQWDPGAAVEELERHGSKEEIAGAYGWYGPFEPLGNSEYDPVFEKLVSLDLPLVLHGPSLTYWPGNDRLGSGLNTFVEMNSVPWALWAIEYVTNLILSGVFDAHEELTVVVLEAGTKWLPFLTHYLDEEYQEFPEDVRLVERLYDAGQRYLDRMPSDYLFENFYFGTQPFTSVGNARHEQAMLEMCHAEEAFVFASDWPHLTFDVPNWVVESPGLDEDGRERVLRGNAEEAYRL